LELEMRMEHDEMHTI
jgi:hypothetical protein